MSRFFTTATLVLLTLTLMGCMRKPYDVPEYEEIGPNETAFLVPLEGDTGKQAKFDSAASLEKLKVATKRIRITHRWNQTGRWENQGSWIADVRLIKVDRSPVTREWTAGTATGTEKKDQAIWAESKDSVGFSTGFSVTTTIEEADASLFLYRYLNKSLSNIMDSEIRARVQSAFTDSAATYDLSDLRAQKSGVIGAVREDVMPFFKGRGITITTLGMFGGLAYENPNVQESIDKVFIAQREKEISAAQLAAQGDKNKTIEMEANAIAEKERRVAKGVADGKQMLLDVAKNAGKDPAFLELRRFEVEEARIAKWDGQYPSYYMVMGSQAGSPTLMLQVPPVESTPRSVEAEITDTNFDKATEVIDPTTLHITRLKQKLSVMQKDWSIAEEGAYKQNLAGKISAIASLLTLSSEPNNQESAQ